jgi:hypothetical protein
VAVPPSPKAHEYDVMASPSGSLVGAASNEHARFGQLAMNAAFGAAFEPGTAMFRPNSEVLPAVSVAVAVTIRPEPLGGSVARKLPSEPAVVVDRSVSPSP